MNSRTLLHLLSEKIRQICDDLPLPAIVTVADTPGSAEAILSNALGNTATICLFLLSDLSAAEHYEDTHMVATLGVGLVINRPLQNPESPETFQVLSAANNLRSRLATSELDTLIHPFPVYQGMEYIRNTAGRFLNGYLLRFDCHYDFTED